MFNDHPGYLDQLAQSYHADGLRRTATPPRRPQCSAKGTSFGAWLRAQLPSRTGTRGVAARRVQGT